MKKYSFQIHLFYIYIYVFHCYVIVFKISLLVIERLLSYYISNSYYLKTIINISLVIISILEYIINSHIYVK